MQVLRQKAGTPTGKGCPPSISCISSHACGLPAPLLCPPLPVISLPPPAHTPTGFPARPRPSLLLPPPSCSLVTLPTPSPPHRLTPSPPHLLNLSPPHPLNPSPPHPLTPSPPHLHHVVCLVPQGVQRHVQRQAAGAPEARPQHLQLLRCRLLVLVALRVWRRLCRHVRWLRGGLGSSARCCCSHRRRRGVCGSRSRPRRLRRHGGGVAPPHCCGMFGISSSARQLVSSLAQVVDAQSASLSSRCLSRSQFR